MQFKEFRPVTDKEGGFACNRLGGGLVAGVSGRGGIKIIYKISGEEKSINSRFRRNPAWQLHVLYIGEAEL